MGNCNNCLVPNNDISNQYLVRDGFGEFTSSRFDWELAQGRISLQEVDQMLNQLKLHGG